MIENHALLLLIVGEAVLLMAGVYCWLGVPVGEYQYSARRNHRKRMAISLIVMALQVAWFLAASKWFPI